MKWSNFLGASSFVGGVVNKDVLCMPYSFLIHDSYSFPVYFLIMSYSFPIHFLEMSYSFPINFLLALFISYLFLRFQRSSKRNEMKLKDMNGNESKSSQPTPIHYNPRQPIANQ